MPRIRSSVSLAILALAACHGEHAAPASAPPAASAPAPAPAARPTRDDALLGLWKARQRFGPDARGPLLLTRGPAGWRADFAGHRLAVELDRDELRFELPAGGGSFRAHLPADRRAPARITGHWIAPPSVIHGSRFASPVELTADGADRWRGTVAPLDDSFTLYLQITRRADGALTAFLRNPERNIGARFAIDHLERDGDTVRLVGTRGAGPQTTLLTGHFDRDASVLTFAFQGRGGSYDFHRDDEHSELYPRGQHPARYIYQPPPALADGWPTASLDDVAIDRAAIEAFVQHVLELPIASEHSPEIHGVLVARHGKLALEEYFHGESRDRMHDTRSAAKSLTATVVGAAMRAGAPLALTSPVYAVMLGAPPADLEPRKRAITLAHLLMMRSGFFCDDSNPDAPGNENVIEDQTADPDYYHYSLQVPMASPPDSTSVYCSMNPNLALGMVARATGESVLDVFDRLVAQPLQITRYAWPLDPAGHPYGGGGVRMPPRDFMKLGQLMLDGGAWHGRPVLDRAFVAAASAARHDLNGIQYGYLWWSIAYPYKARTLRAFFAAGNGGQTVMVVPDLDLVIAIFAGNYSDRAPMIHVQQELAPTWILPAVREPGDDPRAAVSPRPFTSPYGKPRAAVP